MNLPITLVQGAYIVAGLAFILALAGLSRHESARAGNRFGIIGMAIALVATIWAATGGVEVAEAGNFTVGIEGSGWLGLALIALLIVTARMSENRIVWIALGVSFATTSLAAAWRWPHSLARAPLRWIVPAAVLLLVLGIAFLDSLVERAETVYQGRESVAATLEHDPRIVLWEHVKGRIAARPWTGYGFGRRILAGPLTRELGNPLLAHAHNLFASQWLQTGLPGLLAFTAFIAALSLAYLRFLRSRDDALAYVGLLGLALVAGFIAKNQTDDFLFRSNAKEFFALTALLLGYGMRREHALVAGEVPTQAGVAQPAEGAAKRPGERPRGRIEPTL